MEIFHSFQSVSKKRNEQRKLEETNQKYQRFVGRDSPTDVGLPSMHDPDQAKVFQRPLEEAQERKIQSKCIFC